MTARQKLEAINAILFALEKTETMSDYDIMVMLAYMLNAHQFKYAVIIYNVLKELNEYNKIKEILNQIKENLNQKVKGY